MDTIAILDFGGQYAHLIANRIRRLNVFSEIVSSDTSAEQLKEYKGIILSGGPNSVYEANAPDIDFAILNLGVPILGICYGHQLISKKLGGKVESKPLGEYGNAQITIENDSSLFKNLHNSQTVWMSHRDSVSKMPDGFKVLATTKDCPITAISNPEKKIFGLQFHPEVTHTKNGMQILENFISICECKRQWNIKNRVPDLIKEIQEQVGDKKVFVLVSGGVDSTVLFTILCKALGSENVRGLHIDTGLMRKSESKDVLLSLSHLGYDLHIEDAGKIFFEKLKGIYDPEQKRKIIGDLIFDVLEQKMKEFDLNTADWFFAQGTIYPDTIESGGTAKSNKIKSHHNRSPKALELINAGKVIEPLKEFYKDEVRELGLLLGLNKKLIMRHPFPGPALGVRILTSEQEKLDINENEICEKIKKITSLKFKLLPVKSVGVQGDSRTHAFALALYGTANWEKLARESALITNNFKGVINRVVYCLSHQEPPEKYFMHKSYITPERVTLVQNADHIFTNFLFEENLMDNINQAPVVLIPAGLEKGNEAIVLRPVQTIDYMTAEFSKIDKELLQKTVIDILKIDKIDAVFYDITNKPPGTIEWE